MGIKSKTRQRLERKKQKRAQKAARQALYQSKIQSGTNSRRKTIAARKGQGRLVKDSKEPSKALPYVPPSEYWNAYWSGNVQ